MSVIVVARRAAPAAAGAVARRAAPAAAGAVARRAVPAAAGAAGAVARRAVPAAAGPPARTTFVRISASVTPLSRAEIRAHQTPVRNIGNVVTVQPGAGAGVAVPREVAPSFAERLGAGMKAVFAKEDESLFIGKKITLNEIPDGWEPAGWHGSQETEQLHECLVHDNGDLTGSEIFIGMPSQAASYAKDLSGKGNHGNMYQIIIEKGTCAEGNREDISGNNLSLKSGVATRIIGEYKLGEPYPNGRPSLYEKFVEAYSNPRA